MRELKFESEAFDFDRDYGHLGDNTNRFCSGGKLGRPKYLASGRRKGIPSYVLFIILVIALILLSVLIRSLPQII